MYGSAMTHITQPMMREVHVPTPQPADQRRIADFLWQGVRFALRESMVNGMDTPKAKITITLRPEVLADIRERVTAGQARSVSAYVEHAIVGQLAAEADFDSLLAELLAETGGPLTDQERASARRVLRGGAA